MEMHILLVEEALVAGETAVCKYLKCLTKTFFFYLFGETLSSTKLTKILHYFTFVHICFCKRLLEMEIVFFFFLENTTNSKSLVLMLTFF